MNDIFRSVDNLRIGKVIEVSGTSIRVELDGKLTELTRSVNGRVYPIGQISSIIKIHYGHRVLFAYVRMLRMKSDVETEEGRSIQPQDDSRVLEADLFGEGVWTERKDTFSFNRGVKTYPLPQQDVYLTTKDELQKLFESAEKRSEEALDPMLDIGSYTSVDSAKCRANLNKLLGHHCAVLGSTGSGKSATVAAIIHSIIDKKIDTKNLTPRIIIIDPHGEYSKAFKDKAVVYRAYNVKSGEGEEESKTLQLPYWLMSAEEFRSLVIGKTEHEATSQNNIISKALSHARMVHCKMIDPAKTWVGQEESDIVPDVPRPINGATKENILSFDRDKPIPFKISDLRNHIENEQMLGIASKKWRKLTPSDKNRQSFESILDKLRVLESDPRLQFIMKEYSSDGIALEQILNQFVGKVEGKPDSPVRIIDISGLPNEVAGPLAALISRLLFQYKVWQTRDEREKDPVLLVCEEAHRYVPNKGAAEYEAAQTAIRRIAKEGRKYGIGLMLVSQRPSDVESTVLSQCNSWIVMRLTNSSDQEHVSKFLPDSLAGFTKQLSSLARREAIFVGEAAAIPAKITIRKLRKDQVPDSNDIKFVDGWTLPYMEDEAISKIAKRWQNTNFIPKKPEEVKF